MLSRNLIIRPKHQRRNPQRCKRNIAENANVHSDGSVRGDAPVTIRPEARGDVVEHRKQDSSFGVGSFGLL